MEKRSIDRRSFVAGATGMAAVAALSAGTAFAAEGPEWPNTSPTPSFFAAPEPITDIAETFDYDVVVMGADWAGSDKFEYLKDYCELVYLDRTPGISTTQVKQHLLKGKAAH